MTTETTRDALDTFLAGLCRESGGGKDPPCWEASEPEGEFDEWSDEPWRETCCARRTLRAMYDAAVAAAYARGVEEATSVVRAKWSFWPLLDESDETIRPMFDALRALVAAQKGG